MNPPQRKKRQPKLKKVNVSAREQWKKILREVDKDEIPIGLLLSIDVNLIDGTQVNIDIRELIKEGNDPDQLKKTLDKKFHDMDDIINDIDFYINIDEIAKTVQPITDEILKNL